MKVFCDTNIILEFLFKRKEAETIKTIFHYLNQKKIVKAISAGSFYTLTYLIESFLKKEELGKEDRIMKLRRILKGLLAEYIIIGDLDWEKGIDDWRFTDLEDSYQYQAALVSECDVFLTLNVRDFKQIISSDTDAIQVCSPDDFIVQYCK
ncbi:PIN domain-containing protein [uncultured Phocaeicola sp.]|uniref:type II toxin-antitoxin system VapC family toxin n=1 Tax=uncultured Phocaeicola sp. TaxID=990718 RepID=UPI0025E53FB5|nr:PIN domain-containing protein [uncultured Phocaeicola sp.]